MKGFVVRYMGKEYKAGFQEKQVHCIVVIQDGVFSLYVGNRKYFIKSNRIAKEGIEIELEVAEFDEASAVITPENMDEICPVDPECQKLLAEQNTLEGQWKKKLEIFRETEAVLKEEGLI